MQRLDAAFKDVTAAADLLWDSPSVQARFEDTGAVSYDACTALGMVGPAARACGLECDVRQDFPAGIYRFAQVPVSTWTTGDVFARAYVRWLEIQRSVIFIREQLQAFPDGPIRGEVGPLKPEHLAVTLVEGWRGEICHVALTDAQGRFSRYKIVDPSFHNWSGLALALRNQQISDSPATRFQSVCCNNRVVKACVRTCGTSRFPISPCATRVSTFPTVAMICRK